MDTVIDEDAVESSWGSDSVPRSHPVTNRILSSLLRTSRYGDGTQIRRDFPRSRIPRVLSDNKV